MFFLTLPIPPTVILLELPDALLQDAKPSLLPYMVKETEIVTITYL